MLSDSLAVNVPTTEAYSTKSILLFSRLDLVPINRSVGLKAKPTKPVTEVLRPVVAKYGLHLSELVARIVSHSSTMAACAQTEIDTQTVDVMTSKSYLNVCVCVCVMQSGESEPLDLGLPISNLDGLRVVLDLADSTPGKGNKCWLVSHWP